MALFMGRIRAIFWEEVLEKIDRKLAGQKGKLLTYVAKLLLIKNTLSSIPLYSAYIFNMPILMVNEIDSKCKKFLWSSMPNKRKFLLVKQETLYQEKMKGGLGLRKMKVLSQSLRIKLVWQFDINKKREWIKVFIAKYLKENHIIQIANPPYTSPLWNGLANVRFVVINNTIWNVGNGESILFWEDAWIRERPLISYNMLKKEAKKY